jgi:hypothetical protein
MSITMYDASIPVFKQMLNGLRSILSKTQTHLEINKIDASQILGARLFPDMFDFTRQVQVATDFAKSVSARLANIEVPSYSDTEKSLSELDARIAKTLAFIDSIKPEQISGSEERKIVTQAGTPKEKIFDGKTYLFHYGLPHFFFHITTAYDILRHCGVEVGKRDYIATY